MAVCKSANSWNSTQTNQFHRNRKQPKPSQSINLPFCEQSRTGLIDVLYSIAVISALGYLIFPYIKLLFDRIMTLLALAFQTARNEVQQSLLVYICIGFTFVFAVVTCFLVFRCTDNRCGSPHCRGLRKAPEFDIQIEDDDSDNDSTCELGREIFRFSPDYSRGLESQLRKFAPPNGKAVLVFRSGCGCAVGKMQVLGSKKLPRKIKK